MNRRPIIQIAPSVFIVLALTILLLPMRWFACWLLAVTVHEAGHVLVSKLCGTRIASVAITPTGLIIETDGLTPGKQLLASLAGPTAGICLMLFYRWLPGAATLALIHSAFNLLPIANMDGSIILRSVLCLAHLSHKADRICHVVERITTIALAGIGLIVAWKLSWMFAGILSVLLLIRMKRNPCKRGILQVQ